MIYIINSNTTKILSLRRRRVNFRSYTTKISDKLKPPWKVLFFGTDDFSLASLKAVHTEYQKQNNLQKLEVVTSFKNKSNPVGQFATRQNLPVHDWPMQSVDDSFHVGLVVSFGHLIPENIIKSFPLGMINVHASLLPRWRGAAPIIYAIANGDVKSGVTIMQIKPEKFDVGDVLSQREIDISGDVTRPTLTDKLAGLGAQVLVESINELPGILCNAKPQSETGITYAPRISSSFATIDWEKMSARDIYNLERALTGVYPLSSKWNGVAVKLLGIKLCDKPQGFDLKAPPGFVAFDKTDRLIKACCLDDEWISIESVRVFQKKEMKAIDFYNGYLSKQPHCNIFRSV